MKRFIVILFLLISTMSFSQSSFELSAFGRATTTIKSEVCYAGGVNFEWIPKSKHIGLNYSMRFGSNEYGNFTFQCPMGIITGLIVMAAIAECAEEISGIGLFLGFVPEGLSYNTYVSDIVTVAPYINPLQMSFSKDEILPLLEIGAKIKMPLGTKFFSCFDFGVQSPYNYNRINTNASLALGWWF